MWTEVDVRDLVCYDEKEPDKVRGVLEYHIGNALRDGRIAMLSCKVPSQWGEVSLFDLCLTFGHDDTAWALAEGGVEGCRVETYHLGPYRSWDKHNGDRSHREDDDQGGDEDSSDSESGDEDASRGRCGCEGWDTCKYCCFGFAVEQGIWMQDWDAGLSSAMRAAREATCKLLISRALNCLQTGHQLPFALSEKAMLRILDLAILTGNKEAASHLARLCKLRPLRRWRACDLFATEHSLIVLKIPSVLLAAVSVGIDFTELWWDGSCAKLPFRETLAFSGRWSDFAQLLPPPPQPWLPPPGNTLGLYLILSPREGFCPDRLRGAVVAGVALKEFRSCGRSLLDRAILGGQADCAVLCVAAGVEMLTVEKNDLRKDGWGVTPQDRQAAAATAAREALAMNWRRQCEKGVAIYQTMTAHMDGTSCPVHLVDEVLAYATEVPLTVTKLDLWEAVKGWYAELKGP